MDVSILGGGPSGLMAAYFSAKNGAETVLFEKKDKIQDNGCAGGLNDKILKRLNIPEGDWILNRVNDIEMNLDWDKRYFIRLKNHMALIINKTRFLEWLAYKAEEKGAEINLGTEVTNINKIDSKVIIDARGINTAELEKHDIAVCAQYIIKDPKIENIIKLWIGWKVAPAGYGWLFPLNDGIARIGIGTCGGAVHPKHYLNLLLNKEYPDARILSRGGGMVPLAKPLDNFVNGNILYVGDRANLCVPVSGAGNISALRSGMLAGITAAMYIKGEIPDLSVYDTTIKKQFVKKLNWSYKLKENITTSTGYLNHFFNKIKPILWLHEHVCPGLIERFCLKNMRF